MSRKVELVQDLEKVEKELAKAEQEVQTLTAKRDSAKAELMKELGDAAVATPPAAASTPKSGKAQKRGRKPAGEKKYPSLKKIVQDILAKSPDGLELGGIVKKVEDMIERKEYASDAKNMSAVVSQATTALKAEKVIGQDKETRKYMLVSAA